MRSMTFRNVEEALSWIVNYENPEDPGNTGWRRFKSRVGDTIEHRTPLATTYMRPTERVLFRGTRRANPFFHFYESLWILDGRNTVEDLAFYNTRMREYSDNGYTFHGAYGHRLREQHGVDQLLWVIDHLRKNPESRRAVLSIWDPSIDTRDSKDIPCNDLVLFKLREGRLNMTVMCRSNDVVWGAYGANAVQFSVLQEIVAAGIGAEVGHYTQISDSFHIYPDNPAWIRMREAARFRDGSDNDTLNWYPEYMYHDEVVRPYPMVNDTPVEVWLRQLRAFLMDPSKTMSSDTDPFFTQVAQPIIVAYRLYKRDANESRAVRVELAKTALRLCVASDWREACMNWLDKSVEK